ncbi:RagB/SusD family nutrient uptake outer membrane protein [Pedobacter hiemivivus]|uniref:RagB/SusD family nutrient uptake outer membrane protein n=1 Tax=Pedobacter hiemivivus TaxID=2530454 RepID=A0A4U1GMB8_9SPHI|nr:RagB/SusD family nutrient uptake outer membrane protein [Pedobacter hiemivivus]TKC65428.1 RagB/SusD family nutrient uptake outer membrane protein [Pedobacter hiemivivus]
MKSTHQLYLTIILLMATTLLASCEKFLNERPSKGTSVLIQNASDLNALLENYNSFSQENNNITIHGTDDNGFSVALYNARPTTFTIPQIEFTLWDKTDLANRDVSDFSGTNFWTSEYNKVFNANLVLLHVDKVTGTAEEKANLKADAHLIRAYSYWQLATAYCLPYTEANKNEPGLPIKTTPDYEVPARSSLAETYQLIEADLAEALKITVPLVQNGKARPWRANTAAANAFAARYYLNRNDYSKALTYANASLSLYSTLINYNTEMSFGTASTVSIDPGTANARTVTLTFPYMHDREASFDPTDAFAWKELLYYRLIHNTTQWYIPSQSLLSLYDQNNDLRYKYHYTQGFSYRRGMTSPSVDYPGYVFFADTKILEGPTVAEMVLTKAECQARIGDFSGAMTTVNLLYSKRTVTGTAPLAAASQDQAINVILQERRREMPFAQRWADIRRFNTNNYANDDVPVITKTFYPYTPSAVQSTQPTQQYTLPANSRRFASPLPQTDINNSAGAIKQNTY